jgi:thymidylate kinase
MLDSPSSILRRLFHECPPGPQSLVSLPLKTVLVTLSGTHGTGKSTNAGMCYFLLKGEGMRFSYIRHQALLEPFGFVLRRLARILGFRKVTDLERTKPVRFSWSVYILLIYIPVLAGGIKLRRLLGYSVVSDRYLYDLLVGFSGDGIAVPVGNLLPRLLPSPDVSFVLDADEGRILASRPEHTAEFIHKERGLYEEAASRFGLKKIRTDEPPGVVWARLLAEIRSVMSSPR